MSTTEKKNAVHGLPTAPDTGLTALAETWASNGIDCGDLSGAESAFIDQAVEAGHRASTSLDVFASAYARLYEALVPDLTERQGWVSVADLLAEDAPRDVLVEPLVGNGHITAFVAPKGSGKSWLGLQIAAALATGRAVLGSAERDPMSVVYLDWENSKRTTGGRLQKLGYNPGDALLGANLHYCLYPDSGAPMTTKDGGAEVVKWIADRDAKFVVVDTLARALQGDETNEAVNLLYAHFIMPLKRAGVTVVLLDHTGHDESHARGASTKGQLWEMEWLLASPDSFGRTSFKNVKDREGWFPIHLDLAFDEGEFMLHENVAPDAVKDFARELDRNAIPLGLSKVKVRELYKDKGWTCPRDTIVCAAQSYRRRNRGSGAESPENGSGTAENEV